MRTIALGRPIRGVACPRSWSFCRSPASRWGMGLAHMSTATAGQAVQATVDDEEQDLEVLAKRVVELERAAVEAHERAQSLNKQQRFQEAQAAYAEMHALEDRASELSKRVGCVQCVLGTGPGGAEGGGASSSLQEQSICSIDPDVLDTYAALYRPTSWEDAARTLGCQGSGDTSDGTAGTTSSAAEALMHRAMGSVLGCAVADAAATGVHWVYDLEVLRSLEEEVQQARRQQPGQDQQGHQQQGQEQQEGVQSSDAGGWPWSLSGPGLEFLDPPRSPFYRYPVGGASPYGEGTAVLLHSLAADGGLDCGRYAERLHEYFGDGFGGYRDVSTKGFLRNYNKGLFPPLTGADDAQANCTARLAPLVAMFGGDPDLLTRVEMATRVTQNSDAACAWACVGAAFLEALVAGRRSVKAVLQGLVSELRAEAAAASGAEAGDGAGAAASAPEQAVPGQATGAGKTGAEGLSGLVQGQSRFGGLWGLAGQVADELQKALDLASTPPREAVAALGRNCHMPNALTTPIQVVLFVEHCQRQHGSPQGEAPAVDSGLSGGDEHVPRWFAFGVRLALREGGCCASRAAYVGACLGAMLGGTQAVPEGWLRRCLARGDVEGAMRALRTSRGGDTS